LPADQPLTQSNDPQDDIAEEVADQSLEKDDLVTDREDKDDTP
jgi:hypothetical protein